MTNYQFDLGLNQLPATKKSHRVWKLVGLFAGLTVVAGLLVYSGGMDSVLKFLGVGASGIYDTTLTNNRQFVGDANFFVDGSQPLMEGVSVFDQFSGIPADPNQNEANKGFVAPVFSSPQDPSQEIYIEHYYTSAVIDLTLSKPLLSAVEVTDFNPDGSNISYAYRTAAQSSSILTTSWQPLDASVANSDTEDGIKVHTAVVEQNIERFVQIKFTFANVDPMNRNAVYAVSLQYKEAEAGVEGMVGEEDSAERNISLSYQVVNAPASADIDILSPDLDNRVVYSQKQVNFLERLSYTFATALTPGAYALVVSAPTIETQILPFLVEGSTDQISLELASFTLPTGQDSGYDLNGDGVVNTLDLQLLMSKFTL
jgi:hypothetical protein